MGIGVSNKISGMTGQKTVTTTPTPIIAAGSTFFCYSGVLVQADPVANALATYTNVSIVSSASDSYDSGIKLGPGQSITVTVTDPSNIFVVKDSRETVPMYVTGMGI